MKSQPAPRTFRSSSKELAWPALVGAECSQLISQLYQLERSQWWPARALLSGQLAQLARLTGYAAEHSTFYAERLQGLRKTAASAEEPWLEADFRRLPLLTRTELLTQAANIHCREVPPAHGEPHLVQTSGSTGQLVAVRRTQVSQLMLYALGMRAHEWHGRDFSRSLAVIRANCPQLDDEKRAHELGWGKPATLLYKTGPAYSLPISTDIARQAAWLRRVNPHYLLTYPTNLGALLDHFENLGERLPALQGVRSLGEPVKPALRKRCQAVWGAPLTDVYSSQELGIIAIECPESGLYHVQSESLLVEILNDAGEPCEPGQEGRVVVTDLHNFATPLIRYDLRDRAELGPACPCGRGLPTLTRILGRERNLVVLPNGQRYWPLVGLHQYQRIAPILQYQLVQLDLQWLELRLVTPTPLTADQERQLAEVIATSIQHPFQIRFKYFAHEIPLGPSGKFEEFVSLVG